VYTVYILVGSQRAVSIADEDGYKIRHVHKTFCVNNESVYYLIYEIVQFFYSFFPFCNYFLQVCFSDHQ
jgi:hypothetical protein